MVGSPCAHVKPDHPRIAYPFARMPRRVLANPDLGSNAKLLMAAILDLKAGRLGRCIASNERLGRDTGLSDGQVKRGLRELEDAGLISRPKKGDGSNGRAEIVPITESFAEPEPRLAPMTHLSATDDPPGGTQMAPEVDSKVQTIELKSIVRDRTVVSPGNGNGDRSQILDTHGVLEGVAARTLRPEAGVVRLMADLGEEQRFRPLYAARMRSLASGSLDLSRVVGAYNHAIKAKEGRGRRFIDTLDHGVLRLADPGTPASDPEWRRTHAREIDEASADSRSTDPKLKKYGIGILTSFGFTGTMIQRLASASQKAADTE